MVALFLSVIEDHRYDGKFEKIYYRHRNYMFNVAYSILKKPYLAEEAVQEAFFKVAKNITRVETGNDDILKSFLYILTKNCAIKIYRVEKNHSTVDIDSLLFLVDKRDLFGNVALEEEYKRVILCISKLPPRYSDIMTLYIVNELNAREIAEIVNLPTATVKTRIRRGESMIQKIFTEKYCYE